MANSIEEQFGTPDPLSPVSYKTIKNSLYHFRRSGTRHDQFDALDIPGHLYFKIVFHFWNGDQYGDEMSAIQSGLLAPSWMNMSEGGSIETDASTINKEVMGNQEQHNQGTTLTSTRHFDNSAYTFLVRNDELERAEKLKQFIQLLSNIATYSPWYFMELTGLDTIIERPIKSEESFKIAEPKSFTIKCLPDAQDNRIATLLDLYRDVVYSYHLRKEIVPANLRKFDMSIFIFDSLIRPLHFSKDYESYGDMTQRNNWTPSYKCIELHDCEIQYNSTKSGYSGLNNAEGFQQMFEIPINVGDAYEYRYNGYIDRIVGDIVSIDLAQQIYSNGHIGRIFVDTPQTTKDSIIDSLRSRLNFYDNVDNQNKREVALNPKSLLGNIFGASVLDVANAAKDMANSVMNGNISGAMQSVKNMKKGTSIKNGWKKVDLGNMYK